MRSTPKLFMRGFNDLIFTCSKFMPSHLLKQTTFGNSLKWPLVSVLNAVAVLNISNSAYNINLSSRCPGLY